MERKVTANVKKVIAEVREDTAYYARSICPFCDTIHEREIEEDNITMIETCYSCNKKYKVKIPKDSI